MARIAFPGYTAYLDLAAAEIGHPEAAIPARRVSTLASMANLCAQAVAARPEHVPGILAKAEEFRDQLQAAWRASELMLADVRADRELTCEPRPASSKPRPARERSPR